MSDKHIFRVRFNLAGGHVHCRLFVAPFVNTTFAKNGDFVVRRGDEFRDLLEAFQGADFISDRDDSGIAEALEP